MDIFEVITGRRNIKLFRPDAIDEATWMKWLEAASYAPNHRMNQPWQVIVIGDEARAKINHKPNFGDAPLVLAFVAEGSDKPIERDENLVAVSSFIQNFSLAAHAAGAGTRWTSIGNTPNTREILGVTDETATIWILGVGYPAEVPEVKERSPIETKIKRLP
ncbi:putative NAD(P)H nitroreductase YfhC [Alicyclobacillus acidoterrestris]|uniref:nitroreductase family protein n=1 Tax=Alicyclobacillus suci TaxID=2816080 RepID=UPI0011921868|nr:nitroreductase family protein [Alicyclobacillus suci]GEO26100.1 putative NAD(P)H nitroreductase YfhC [Alicyclobacillus acidoterrestris]